MTLYSADEIIRAAHRQNSALEQEIEAISALAEQHRRDLLGLRHELEAAWEHLASTLVPSLDRAALDAAAARLALPTIAAARVEAERAEERRQIEAELAQIDADPLYVQREGLLNEQSIRVPELEDLIAPLAEARRACEAQPLWDELHASGYDTPEYAVKWYMLHYYTLWKHGDLALAALQSRFPAAQRFADLRAKYDELCAAEQELAGEREALLRRGKRVAELTDRRALLQRRLEGAPQRALALARGRVQAHLSQLDAADAGPLLADSRAASFAYKRVLGLAAKQRYLEALGKQLVQQPRAQLEVALAKNQREIAKKQRPKQYHAQHSVADFGKRFGVRQDAWDKRRDRYARARGQLLDFSDYSRAEFARDFLWWDLMTDGRLDGDFIDEVATYRRSHGERRSRDDRDDAHAAAVAAVAGQHARDPDDDLIHDGS